MVIFFGIYLGFREGFGDLGAEGKSKVRDQLDAICFEEGGRAEAGTIDVFSIIGRGGVRHLRKTER
jgi:hypothetical protein